MYDRFAQLCLGENLLLLALYTLYIPIYPIIEYGTISYYIYWNVLKACIEKVQRNSRLCAMFHAYSEDH